MPSSSHDSFCLFAPEASRKFGAEVAAALGATLTAHEEREFDGGEHKMRPLENVRGKSAYVIHSLCGDALGSANDRLCRVLFFIGALRDAGAACVTACLPYLAYARKDRRTQQYDPVTTRYVAQLFEAVGAHRVVALDVHNPAAFDNAFRCETVHLEAAELFVRHFAALSNDAQHVIVSPDIGGVKRARRFQDLLELSLGRGMSAAFMDKKRSRGVVSGETLVGDVAGRHVVIVDDLISSGTTVLRTVEACRRAGAERIDVAATHAVFSRGAARLFQSGGPDSVVVTDSVSLADDYAQYLHSSLTVLNAAPLFAQAIRELDRGR